MYRILSLDGGGIRGLLTARLLGKLEEAQPGFLDKVDLISGTSTGGILALGLAAGMTPAQCGELYEVRGQEVFARTVLQDLGGHIVGAKYATQPLKRELDRQFGDLRMRDLKKKVLIPAFDLDNRPANPYLLRTWKPKFFHNLPPLSDKYPPTGDPDERVADVALRTSAAPSFFPIYQNFVDGGVAANNPSMCALAQALHPGTGGQRVEDLVLLSVGTGCVSQYIDEEEANWGLIQWARPVISLLLEGDVTAVDYQCRQILGDRYHRLNPVLPEPINLDDVDKIPRLKEIADEAKTDVIIASQWLTPVTDTHDRFREFRGWFVG